MTGIFQQIQEATRNETVTVGTSSQVISEARNEVNPRKVINIRNIGTTTITVSLGFQAAVNNAGVVLKPNESFSDSQETGYVAYQGGILAISDGAGGSLAIYER
jgi:hypothetical protein